MENSNQKAEDEPKKTLYLCLQCGCANFLNKAETVKCRECDYRVLCKKRNQSCRYLCR